MEETWSGAFPSDFGKLGDSNNTELAEAAISTAEEASAGAECHPCR